MNTSNNKSPHIPIMVQEISDFLDIQPNDIILDGTIGFGGHASHLVTNLSNKGRLIGLDQDQEAVNFCKNKFKNNPNIIIEHENFANFPKNLPTPKVNKVLIDLGMSSFHLDHANRGFTFQGSEPLDMRMNQETQLTAEKILNTYPENKLIEIFKSYGELFKPEKFASKILEYRKQTPYKTTDQLVQTIKKGFYFRNKRSVYMRTCAQVFQALRIEINQELAALENFLSNILDYLAPNGKIAILSFHSLEDRQVKQFGKKNKFKFQKLSSKVIKPTQTEIKSNPRAKSAKLRLFNLL